MDVKGAGGATEVLRPDRLLPAAQGPFLRIHRGGEHERVVPRREPATSDLKIATVVQPPQSGLRGARFYEVELIFANAIRLRK